MGSISPQFIKDINNSFIKTFNRVIEKTGMLTLFLSIGSFGISTIVFNSTTALLIWVNFIGFGGAFEIYHKQAQIKLDKRKQLFCNLDTVMWNFQRAYPQWAPKIFNVLKHHDFIFRTIGFKEIGIPFIVYGPLCPNCKKLLIENSKIVFPWRVRIIYKCICGYIKQSKETKAELIYNISIFTGIPIQENNKTNR